MGALTAIDRQTRVNNAQQTPGGGGLTALDKVGGGGGVEWQRLTKVNSARQSWGGGGGEEGRRLTALDKPRVVNVTVLGYGKGTTTEHWIAHVN